jgi:hypothetical protein
VLASERPKSLTEFMYSSVARRTGVSVGAGAAVIRRFLATFTLRTDEGMPGINIWHFRVMGDPSFWHLGRAVQVASIETRVDSAYAFNA